MYRDVVVMAKSLFRTSYEWPSLCLTYSLGSLSGRLTAKMMDSIGFQGDDYNYKLDNGLSFGVLVSAVTMKSYLDLRRQGVPASALRYEDLVAQPLDICRRLMEVCGLPVNLAELAVKALEKDSQRNTPLAKEFLSKLPEPKLTEEAKTSLNVMLKNFGLPLIGESGILEGTLGHE